MGERLYAASCANAIDAYRLGQGMLICEQLRPFLPGRVSNDSGREVWKRAHRGDVDWWKKRGGEFWVFFSGGVQHNGVWRHFSNIGSFDQQRDFEERMHENILGGIRIQ